MITTALCCYPVKTYFGIPLNSTKSEFVSRLVKLGLKPSDENSYLGKVDNIQLLLTFKTDSKNGIKEVTEVFKVEDRNEAIERLSACRNTVKFFHDDAVETELPDGFIYLVDGGKAAVSITLDVIKDDIYVFYTTFNGLPD